MYFWEKFRKPFRQPCTKKKKILWGNQKLHVNKTLRSVIMKGSQLKKNKAMKSESQNDVTENKKQLSKVVKLNKSYKKEKPQNLKTTKITQNYFGQFVSHISLINMSRVMEIFSLLKIIKIWLDNRKVAIVLNG